MAAINPPRLVPESEVLALANEAQEPLLIRLVDVLRTNPMLTVGLSITFSLLIVILVAPFLLPDPSAIDASASLKGPSLAHLFGTDNFGRDIFSRVVMGGRTSLMLAFFSISLAALIGVPIGLIAGYTGGVIDTIFMRILDSVLAFPVLLLAMFVVASLGPGTSNLTITIGFVFMPYFARLVRAQALRLRELQFVEASIQYGTHPVRLLLQVILPNSFAPLLVEFSSSMAFAILTEAGLSFLGLGVQPPDPAWGLMLKESQIYLQQALWYAIAPGAAIFLAVLGFNMVGDGLRDVFDPTLRRES
jgi:ABC-type dipeptide/oligopeptide/nickel transport system permease subunit